jgi:hypothetical protein
MKTKQDVIAKLMEIQSEREAWLAVYPRESVAPEGAQISPELFTRGTDGGDRIISANITEKIYQFDGWIADSDFHPDAYEIVLKCDEMLEAWTEWAKNVRDAQEGTSDHNSHASAPTCWSVFDDCLRLIEEPTYRQPEPITTLLSLEPPLSLNQIANIYGWQRPDGSWDTDKVKEEQRTPGRHYDPETWVNPEKTRKAARVAERWSERQAERKTDSRTFEKHQPLEQTRADWVDPEVAVEPIEQLLKMPGMNVQQVANMKKMSVEEVQEYAKKLHIAVDHSAAIELDPSLELDPTLPMQNLHDIQTKIDANFREGIKTYPEKGDLVSQAIAIINDRPDLSDEEIHVALSPQHPNSAVDTITMVRTKLVEIHSDLPPAQQLTEQEKALPELTAQLIDEVDGMNRKQLRSRAKELGITMAANVSNEIAKQMILGHYMGEEWSAAEA